MFDSNSDNLSTKERLVAAAASLLMRQGFGTVSVDDICKAADIKKGTFYHHFQSKTDLALAAYEYMEEQADVHFKDCCQPDLPAIERLERFSAGMYSLHNEIFLKEGKVYGCGLCSAGQEMGAQDERIRLKIKEIYDCHADYFRSIARDLPAYQGAPDDKIEGIASEMQSYITGVLHQAKVANDPDIIKRDLFAGLKRLAGA